eukprot:s2480_g9.t2
MAFFHCLFVSFAAFALGKLSPGEEPLPAMADSGKKEFDAIAGATANSVEGLTATVQSNPLQFPLLTDFWCAYELTDRKRTPALLIDDMQVEYAEYVHGIVPQVKLLLNAFREAGLPVFWSTWWRWGPDDGFFNSMDRFYGPIGWNTSSNALYNHKRNGGDVLPAVAPQTPLEWRRVMHKSYSLDMFDERPMEWASPSDQGTLHVELQKLGVDTVVQVGAWTDDCIISTAFHAFSLQYDVILIEDGVSTASKQHFNAIEVMRGALAKVLFAEDVAAYIRKGLPVLEARAPKAKLAGSRARAARMPAAAAAVLALASKADAEHQEPLASAASERISVDVAMRLVFAVGCTSVFSFVSGWVLRGVLSAKANIAYTAKSQSQLEKDRLLQNDDTISQARSELEQTLKQQKTEACVPAVPSAVPVA